MPNLRVLAESGEAGLALAESLDHSQVFMTGHLEYDRGTLDAEYRRDLGKGLDPVVPRHYYPGNNPSAMPLMTWRAHAPPVFQQLAQLLCISGNPVQPHGHFQKP